MCNSKPGELYNSYDTDVCEELLLQKTIWEQNGTVHMDTGLQTTVHGDKTQ